MGEPVVEGVEGSDHRPFHLTKKYLEATPVTAGPSQLTAANSAGGEGSRQKLSTLKRCIRAIAAHVGS